MKRKGNLYKDICDFDNILKVYNTVCRNTKNKRKVNNFNMYKCTNIYRIHKVLNDKTYIPGKYNVFTIYEPKERRIVSLNMFDKVINHLISEYILFPSLSSCLIDQNVASRVNMGVSKGIFLRNKYDKYFKNNNVEYYILKCDISKFFASIDIDILKEKLKKKIKDRDALDIVFKVLDNEEKGLSIGSMTSQLLAVFFMNDLDHYIKEKLKVKGYIRYQDDFLLFHESKKYLRFCLSRIINFLYKEKLKLNKKTRIFKSTDNYIFLGRNRFNRYSKYRVVLRKIKKRRYLYCCNKITLNSYISSIIFFSRLNYF